MRFVIMHNMADELEKGLPPAPTVLAGIGKLIEEGIQQKVFVCGEGRMRGRSQEEGTGWCDRSAAASAP